MQSLDADHNIAKEIIIPPEVETAFQDDTNAINKMTLEELAQLAGVSLVSESDAIKHLKNSMGVKDSAGDPKDKVYSHALDGRTIWISSCDYKQHDSDPKWDNYSVMSLKVSFKDGHYALGNAPARFPYKYTSGQSLDLLTPNSKEAYHSGNYVLISGMLYEAIGKGYYHIINPEDDEFETAGFWSSKEKAQAYQDAVTAKEQRTCEITPGPDLSL